MTLIQDDAAPRLSLPRLHLIVDPTLCREHGIAPSALAACAAADGRAVAVHLREPNATAAALWRLAVDLRAVIAPPARLIINDRADVAVAVGADGVHLGGHGLPVAAARHVVGPRLLLGRSVHSVAEARTAEREGADYALLGTIYPTASHPDVVGAGPVLVRAACAAVCFPVIAVGGIDQTTLGSVLDAGADDVAVLRAVGVAADPGRAVAALDARITGDRGDNGVLPLPQMRRTQPGAADARGRGPAPMTCGANVDGGDTR